MSRRRISIAVTLGAFWDAVALGQVNTASLTGLVKDPSDALVVEAAVKARNMDTGMERSTITNSSDREREVLAALLRGIEPHCADRFLEAGLLHRDLIRANRKIGKSVCRCSLTRTTRKSEVEEFGSRVAQHPRVDSGFRLQACDTTAPYGPVPDVCWSLDGSSSPEPYT